MCMTGALKFDNGECDGLGNLFLVEEIAYGVESCHNLMRTQPYYNSDPRLS